MKRVVFLFVLLLTIGLNAFAQDDSKDKSAPETHTVSGKVMDELGKGLLGAYVSVSGGNAGTSTDVNGDFMFEAPDGATTIVISANGYATMYIEDEGQSIEVKMQPLAKMLEGHMNTAVTGKKDKRETGFNSTTMQADDLISAGNNSILSALQGKVPGANITSSTGAYGGSTRVVLRGEKSLLKNNNALIVVDGIITNNYDRTISNLFGVNPSFSELNQVDFGNSANDLSTEDIESVTVLPGAAATALYGAMGANGAIMYTTKKGKHQKAGAPHKMDITVKTTYSQSDVLKYPSTQNVFGQGNIYGGVADDRSEYRSWGYEMDDALRPWGQVIDGKQLVKPYSNQPNNIRNFYNRGINANNYVAINGGSDKSTYMLSFNSVNTSGVVPNTFYNRYNVRFNGSTELSHNLYSAINMNYMNSYSRVETSGDGPGGVINSVINTPRDIPLWEMSDLTNKYYSQQYYDTSGGERFGSFNGSFKNPYWIAKNYDNRNKTDRVLGDWKMGWKKADWHVFNRFGVDATSDRSSYNMPQYNTTSIDPTYNAAFNSAGGYTKSNYNGMRLYNDLIVNYTHQLSKNFGFSGFAGHNLTFQRDEMLAGIIDPLNGGLVVPGYYNLSNNAGPVTGYNNITNRRTVGVFYNLDFNYRRELFLNIAGRNDWSSTMASNRRSYFYPTVNSGWVFTERLNGTRFKEKVLNYGKLRIAGSGAGNDAIAYANNNAGYLQAPFRSAYSSVGSPFNGIPTYQLASAFGTGMLRPERTREFEVGTDLSFLRDRLNASFTYYRSYTSDMIAAVPLSNASGYQFNYINVGDVSNNGIEIAMRGTPISTRWGLRWDLFGTYTRNVNTVESINAGVENISLGGYQGMQIVAAKGRPMGSFYAADIEYWQNPTDGSWHAVVDPATGLPRATKDPVYKGSYQPKFVASWGTDVTYKGLKLHALFYTKQGNVFYSQTKMNMDANGTSEETVLNGRNAFVWENSVSQVPNTNIYLPNTTKTSAYEYYTAQQKLYPAQGIVNGSYVRLQELALSYKIPQRYYERSPFGALEAGVFGNNLLLWTASSNKYDDPDATSAGAMGNGQGFNYLARPTTRNYGLFVKVNF